MRYVENPQSEIRNTLNSTESIPPEDISRAEAPVRELLKPQP